VTRKLETVEMGRGLAALAVVLFHANGAADFIGARTAPLLSLGEHGVDFFFVLSGFIIFFVHRGDIGQPAQARDYALKRFIRLFPLLWLVVLSWSALKAGAGEAPSLSSLATSLFLYPSTAEPIPLVVWTLRHEALFYLAFLLLIWDKKSGIALFAAWTAGSLIQLGLSLSGRAVAGLGAFLLSSYQLDFMMGMGVAYLHSRFDFRASFVPLAGGVLAVAALLAAGAYFDIVRESMLDYSSVPATAWTLALGLAFAGLLHGLLCIEKLVTVPRSLVLLGGASYALYLVHTPANVFLQRIAAFLPGEVAILFMAVFGVAAGLVAHLYLEKPMTGYLRHTLLPKRRAAKEGIRTFG